MDDAPFELAGGRVTLGGTTVLDGIDFRVGPGEFVAVLGANGSGKTTLVRTLVGLEPLSGGRLWAVDRRRIGYVPQRAATPGSVPATVREVVFSGRTAKASRFRPWSDADRCAVDCAIEAVGLADRARDPVTTLSGGQQQRVQIARALAGDPAVLVLDEPTAGVDAESQDAFAATLRLLKDEGTAVLLVAHELGPLGDLVDRVVILSHGEVAYDGPDVPPGWHDVTHHTGHH